MPGCRSAPALEPESGQRDSSCRPELPKSRGARKTRVADAASRARGKKRRAQNTAEQLMAEAADESRVANWIATRALAPSTGPTASARMAALRDRLGGTPVSQHLPSPPWSHRAEA